MNSSTKYGVQSTESKNGFTLLEVLIAVAIMAGIVSVIYAGFFTSGRNVEQAEAIRDSTDLARTLMQKVANDVTNAYVNSKMNSPTVITILNGKKQEALLAEKTVRRDSILLTTLTNPRRINSKESGIWEVGYFFKEKQDGSGSVLMRREKRELSKDILPGEGGIEYPLTDKVKALQFRYNPAGGMSTWQDEWNSATRGGLPKYVEVVFTLDSDMSYTMDVEVRNPVY